MTIQPSIIIPMGDIQKFSIATRTEIKKYFTSLLDDEMASNSGVSSPSEDQLVEITNEMLQRFVNNISPKTLSALRVIAQSESPSFHLKDVVSIIGDAETPNDIKSIWTGLTRRTRTITDNKKAKLISWGYWEEDEAGNNIDCIGVISPVTHDSLREYFNL